MDRVRTRARGASLLGDVEPLLSGGEAFRPTGIVATADGTVYIADWADRRYPVHGKGRVWRLAVNDDSPKLEPALPFSREASRPEQQLLAAIQAGVGPDSLDELMEVASGEDAFLASAAATAMGRDKFREPLEAMLRTAEQPRVRLAALLALRDFVPELHADLIQRALLDPDPRVRQMTMIWIGESMRMDMADALAESMSRQTTSPTLFETFLATSQLLTDAEAQRVRDQVPGTRIDRAIDQSLIRRLIADPAQPDEVRAMALRYFDLTSQPDAHSIQWLVELAGSGNLELASEAVRTLADAQNDLSSEVLLAIAKDVRRDPRLRADAIQSTAAGTPAIDQQLVQLVRDPLDQVSLAAARALGKQVKDQSINSQLQSTQDLLNDHSDSPRLAEQLRFALGLPAQPPRPVNDQQWEGVLKGGDVVAGRRVFFDRRVTCAKCHRVDGRGGTVGPDLTNIASAKTPLEILQSILHPSKERSPDYQGYAVLMTDGQTHLGTQFHFRGESADLLTVDGEWIRFALSDTDDYRPLETSLMPEGLAELMSVGELQDLMAFLTVTRK